MKTKKSERSKVYVRWAKVPESVKSRTAWQKLGRIVTGIPCAEFYNHAVGARCDLYDISATVVNPFKRSMKTTRGATT